MLYRVLMRLSIAWLVIVGVGSWAIGIGMVVMDPSFRGEAGSMFAMICVITLLPSFLLAALAWVFKPPLQLY